MNLHEYQAKEIFRQYHLPVPPSGGVARTPEEAVEIARRIGGGKFVVKAQVHAGGRGKAGGVLPVEGLEAVRSAAKKLLGTCLKTHQTGPEGQPVDLVLVEPLTKIAKEFYAAVVLDRSSEKPCLIFSEAGGIEIEEVAQKTPEAVFKKTFSARTGLSLEEVQTFLNECRGEIETRPDTHGRGNPAYPCLAGRQAAGGGRQAAGRHAPTLAEILAAMAKIFLEKDASLVEVNPLGILESGEWRVVDAKMRLDDNGLKLHPELAAYHDPRQEDPRETEAKKFGLSYVGLEGNIGCMVNGAGLSMATMDLIKLAGGVPANFLDVGGGASADRVTAAFKIILTDSNVRAILVNIFGGIMRCDVVSEGILAAVKEIQLKVPLVVRLEGTQAKEGKEILKKSRLEIISAESLAEAAKKAVACVHSG